MRLQQLGRRFVQMSEVIPGQFPSQLIFYGFTIAQEEAEERSVFIILLWP